MSKCKFEVGDRVRTDSMIGYFPQHRGAIGTIIQIYSGDTILVEFDYDINGHSGLGYGVEGKAGHCWWVRDEEICLLNEKIVITTDGKTTTAKMYLGKTVVDTKTARCHPNDTFDFKEGARIVFDRLVGEKEPETPKFYNGKVICVDTTDTTCGYVLGKIYEIKDGYLYKDGCAFYPTTPASTLAEFKSRSSAKWLEVVE